jgi:lipoprotein-anchoring transpeptidase ErfK/SrfK
MKSIASLFPFALLSTLALPLAGCKTAAPEVTVPASMAVKYAPVENPNNVRVRVSLNNMAVYVYEGEKPVFVAAVAVGKADSPTPTGDFKAFNLLPRKRSNTYGFWVKGEEIRPGRRDQMPSGYRYVGYPMPWWVEFKSGYGFHAGGVWPEPRTKGCLRLHRTVAEDFFRLVKPGTPIHIAHSLPEDATLGKNVPRPTDYAMPDHPPSVLITDAPFNSTDILF